MSTEPKVIRATFLETEAHYRTAWERNPKKPRYWLMLLIVFPLVSAGVLPDTVKHYREGDANWWVGYASMLVVMVLIWLCVLSSAAQWRLIRRSVRKNLTNPPTEAWAEFSEAGFLSTGKEGKSSFHPWTTVPSAVELGEGIYFYLDDAHQSYFWFPKDAFASESEYIEMADLAGRKVNKFSKRER